MRTIVYTALQIVLVFLFYSLLIFCIRFLIYTVSFTMVNRRIGYVCTVYTNDIHAIEYKLMFKYQFVGVPIGLSKLKINSDIVIYSSFVKKLN